MRFIEALQKLNELDDIVPAKSHAHVPAKVGAQKPAVAGDDLNDRLIKKIDIIADALANAFEKEGIDLDAKLVADDIRRDCGLMGGIIGTDELDVNGNPFDAATKQMHDMGPVDTNRACQMLLNVQPHEFVAVFMDGLKRNAGLLPGGPGRALPGRARALPNRGARRIGESKDKDYSYIDELVKKFAAEIGKPLDEDVLNEKITDLKGYFKSNKNKEKFDKIGMTEKQFMQMADIDPTHEKGSNGGGSYIEWLLKLLTTETTTFRDMMAAAHEYSDQLAAFDDLKRRKRIPENKRDIMQVRNLEDLMNLVITRGEEEVKQDGANGEGEPEGDKKKATAMSDFKQDLKDFPALVKKLTWPDDVTGTYEDHMELVGENDKWEVWKVKSPLGAFVFDQWGDGAKWCVGGFGYKGAEGKRSAQSYYNNYLHNGEGVYVCFQQKNKNAQRPNNKALITFDDSSRYKVSQFNHANNGAYYSGGYGADTAAEFAKFLIEENLFDVLKGTEFGNCEAIKDVENMERLKKGEPYIYNGEKIKDSFKEFVKKVVFSEDYSREVSVTRNGQSIKVLGIPHDAFKGCSELEDVDMPITIEALGYHAFFGCDKATIRTPRHRISCYPADVEYLRQHVVYTDEQSAQPKEADKPEGE